MAILLTAVDLAKLFFDSASDLAKQLIAVSTGIVGLSITFLKDVIRETQRVSFGLLTWAWYLYLCSILFGFWTLMATTGSIERLLQDKESTPIVSNIRLPAGLQIVFFFVATILLVFYGVAALRELKKKPAQPPTRQSSAD